MIWFLLLIGLLSGWVASMTSRGSGFGIWGDLVTGVIGSVLGAYLFIFMGMSKYGTLGTIVSSVLGSVILLGVIRMFRVANPAYKKK